MKKLLALLFVFLLAFGAIGASAEGVSDRVLPLEGYEMVEVPTDIISYDNEMVMTYIQEFANFTQVPRPTHNTVKMTEYLVAWAAARGIECETEEIGNVIMTIPATEGYEDAPMVAFQGHIDMVAATDDGVEHDWANDPLDLIWTSNTVKADGTSLGADNGTGLAFMLTYMDYADTFVHGPVRFLFTVDEEEGMYGATAMDPKYVADVAYLVNVDGGYGSATVSCAGGKYFDFTHAADWGEVPEGTVAYAVEFAGLKGGHSAGVGGGKANGLVATANALLELYQAGISFNLVNFEGGDATNAIPTGGKALIAIAEADVEAANAKLDEFAKLFKTSYEAVETEYTFTYGASEEAMERALSAGLSASLVQLMSIVPNNIHTLLPTTSGTESSSNLGLLIFDDEQVGFKCYMRSSSTYQAEQMTLINLTLAELTGFDVNIPAQFAAWPLKADNKLGDITAALFKEMTGNDFPLHAIHAGLECGEFAAKNEDMYILATGVSGGSAGHTTEETMNFDQVEASVDFLVALAQRLAEEG